MKLLSLLVPLEMVPFARRWYIPKVYFIVQMQGHFLGQGRPSVVHWSPCAPLIHPQLHISPSWSLCVPHGDWCKCELSTEKGWSPGASVMASHIPGMFVSQASSKAGTPCLTMIMLLRVLPYIF